MPYIPPNCITLDKAPQAQIRLGIQGFPNTGKTIAASTFPNPLYVNQDRGLGALLGRADIAEAAFYDIEFCKKVNPNYRTRDQLKDTMLMWLDREGKKFEPDQTLVWDGLTSTSSTFHKWFEANQHQFLTKQNQVNEFAVWDQKIMFFDELCAIFKTLRCHVVFITHESERPDKGKPGEAAVYSGKIRPLITGSFRDQIASHFTDWFRQHCESKPTGDLKEDKLKLWGLGQTEFNEMLNTFKGNSIYFWQTEGDDIFDAKRSSLIDCPRFIPANFQSFQKYMKISTAQRSETLATHGLTNNI